MRNIISGFALVGLLTIGTAAMAHPLGPSTSVAHQPSGQRVDWNDCGPRCQERRHEARERELEHRRWAEHRRWEEHHGWEDSHRYPPPPVYDYQHRY
jgi:hypothetical protein